MPALSSKIASMEAEDCLKPRLGVKRHHFYTYCCSEQIIEFRAGLWVEKWIFTFDERNSEVTLRKNMHTDMGGFVRPSLQTIYITSFMNWGAIG